tara:strand:- start:3168 stop:3371 length:204 start_codon:yes stop_codon:yes gene_type:complete
MSTLQATLQQKLEAQARARAEYELSTHDDTKIVKLMASNAAALEVKHAQQQVEERMRQQLQDSMPLH